MRHGGSANPVVVLLHGLVATGDVFGAAFDPIADQATLVVPDLLGFGRSLDDSRERFTPDDHLDALDEMLDALGLAARPVAWHNGSAPAGETDRVLGAARLPRAGRCRHRTG